MTNIQTQNTQVTKPIKEFLEQSNVKKKFEEMLGKRSNQFLTSVLQIVSSNDLLKNADPNSVYMAAVTAATLDLPLNNNLGYAYIVPYSLKQKDGSTKQVAQFQMGYKSFIQLAQRSGQFKLLEAKKVYEGQYVEDDSFLGFKLDWKGKKSDIVIGYAAYFLLLNGFEKTLFMSITDLNEHARKYSKSFQRGYGLWKDDFDAMAIKTVIKLLLSKYAPLSVEMQRAVISDQSVVHDADTINVEYVDNEEIEVDKSAERVRIMIDDCTSVDELLLIKNSVPMEMIEWYDNKMDELKSKK